MEGYVYIAVLGALTFFTGSCIFSFLNVIVYRLPREMSFIKGRSICPSCGHPLGGLDLIPVFSYLFLRGTCRYCGEKIGARDTFVELFGGLAALFCGIYYGWQNENYKMAVLAFAFISILTVVTFLDIDTMEIADGCSIAIVVLAVIAACTMGDLTIVQRLIGMVCVSVPMLLLAIAIPGAFGGGDIKLMAASGLFLGWKLILAAMALGILFGGIWGIYLLAAKKKERKEQFAFGPFLCAGLVIGMIYGSQIIDWYVGFMV